MPLTDSQKRAKETYRKKSVSRYTFEFYPADAEIFEHLQAQPNKRQYLLELIAADIETKKSL